MGFSEILVLQITPFVLHFMQEYMLKKELLFKRAMEFTPLPFMLFYTVINVSIMTYFVLYGLLLNTSTYELLL